MRSVADLVAKAKDAIAAGEASFHDAAEYIAAAQLQGASQRTIAREVGKSQPWVNRLLGWRRGGFLGDPFGPDSRKRPRVSDQAADQHQAKTASAGNGAYYEHFGTGPKQRHDARRADFDFEWFSAELKKATDEPAKIGSTARATLVKMLGVLGSAHEKEVLTAARFVEDQRRKLGMTWQDLIIASVEDAT